MPSLPLARAQVLSSAVITHAFLHWFERLSNWWMCRRQRNPLTAAATKKAPAATVASKPSSKDPEALAHAANADAASLDPLMAAHVARGAKPVFVEGQPIAGVLGCAEWALLAFGLLALYLAQFVALAPPALRQLSAQYWMLASGGYAALMFLHGVITTRDG